MYVLCYVHVRVRNVPYTKPPSLIGWDCMPILASSQVHVDVDVNSDPQSSILTSSMFT